VKTYRNTEIRQLAHELTLSPLRLRLRQVSGIHRAIDTVEHGRDYPYSLICFLVTGYRPRRRTDDALLPGQALKADLVDLLDGLTVGSPLPLEAAQGRLYDTDALSRRFNVSTKTISRWRHRGLGGCWYADGGDRPFLAFSTRAVERFVGRNVDLVRRGSAFAVMKADEKRRIFDRARRLVASSGCTLHAATVQIAEETGRAVETIRYTLRKYDRDHPGDALFDRAEQARPIDEGELMLKAHDGGASIADIARQFEKRESQIRRLLVVARSRRLASSPVQYVYNELFDAPDAAAQIDRLRPRPVRKDNEPDETLQHPPSELPPYLQDLYRTPLLTREEEAQLFARMNCLLHEAEIARQALAEKGDRSQAADVTAVEVPLSAAGVIKNKIIQANLRLVVSIAKRHTRTHPALSLFELVSDGNVALMRAAERFDFARGFRFSTYASWAIMRGFARSVPETVAHHGRFQTGCDEVFEFVGDASDSLESNETSAATAKTAVLDGLDALDDRERTIVVRHFGLASGDGAAVTLDAIGRDLGISKERVRQIELRALAKLRERLADRRADLLAG
jgi:RNA polymerase primary sigma factor/RNA polymerase sigma factor